MKKLAIFLLSLLFSLSVPLLSTAQEMGHPMGQGEHSCMKHMRQGKGMDDMRGGFGEMELAEMFKTPRFYLAHSEELKLSEEQAASLKKISFELKKDMIAKSADVRMRRLELAEILARPDYKLEDATAKLKDLEDARLALQTALLRHSAQARDVLTADQLKGLKDICRHECCGKSCGKGMKGHMCEKEMGKMK